MTDIAQLSLLDADPSPSLNYGWMGTIPHFLATTTASWLEILQSNYQALYQQQASATQRQAWQDCGEILQQQLGRLVQLRPESTDWTLIFEYELPQEGGRRPDLVLLAAGHILVFEFKQKSKPVAADLDQVAAYARDLAEYHQASHLRSVTPILVPTRCQESQSQRPRRFKFWRLWTWQIIWLKSNRCLSRSTRWRGCSRFMRRCRR
ncbi:MAG: hypothetical protein HC827_22745 [Cyanobacteria bacterium RM1_2_2]|nr:hypothetical protein [Cyanobacteria bacterium RM1_2_2]